MIRFLVLILATLTVWSDAQSGRICEDGKPSFNGVCNEDVPLPKPEPEPEPEPVQNTRPPLAPPATPIERLERSMNEDADEHWLGYDHTSKRFSTEKQKEGEEKKEYSYDLCSIQSINYIALEENSLRVLFNGGQMKVNGRQVDGK